MVVYTFDVETDQDIQDIEILDHMHLNMPTATPSTLLEDCWYYQQLILSQGIGQVSYDDVLEYAAHLNKVEEACTTSLSIRVDNKGNVIVVLDTEDIDTLRAVRLTTVGEAQDADLLEALAGEYNERLVTSKSSKPLGIITPMAGRSTVITKYILDGQERWTDVTWFSGQPARLHWDDTELGTDPVYTCTMEVTSAGKATLTVNGDSGKYKAAIGEYGIITITKTGDGQPDYPF